MKTLNSEATCAIILGMHRSGTSCLAGNLQYCGLFLGEVFEKNKYNLKGNRENKKIMYLNEDILKASGGSWDNPPSKIYWEKKQIKERDKIIKKFSLRSKLMIWGFKDPRSLFTLPFWKDGLINIKLVGTFRHPILVAKSLNARNNQNKIPFMDGLELWKKYNMKLLSYLNEYNFPLISFDVSKREYLSSIRLIVEYIGIKNKNDIDDIPFFDELLKHQVLMENENILPDEIKQLYEILNQIYHRQFIS